MCNVKAIPCCSFFPRNWLSGLQTTMLRSLMCHPDLTRHYPGVQQHSIKFCRHAGTESTFTPSRQWGCDSYECPVLPIQYGTPSILGKKCQSVPCFLDGNANLNCYTQVQQPTEGRFWVLLCRWCGRRGSHVYEINTLLWNFGLPQPRVGGFSVGGAVVAAVPLYYHAWARLAKTEKIWGKSRTEAAKRARATKQARKWH
jgi:hypothetical protein